MEIAQPIEMVATALLEPLRMFANPDERVYWPHLLASVILAGLAALVFQRPRKWSAARLVQTVLPKKLLLHPSAVMDYRLLFAKAIIRALFITPWALTALTVVLWIVNMLDTRLGIPEAANWPLLGVTALYTIVLFVVWDFSRYLLHRLQHEVPFLWEFHKVHHSAEVLTPLTLYRTHPVESLIYGLRGVLVTGLVTGVFFYFFRSDAVQYSLLGVNAFGFLFNLFGANLRHSHVWISYGPLERIFISPAQHQIHHSSAPEHLDRNFGTWLSVWDGIAGSLCLSGARQKLSFGLSAEERNHNPHSVMSALLRPMMAAPVRLMPAPLVRSLTESRAKARARRKPLSEVGSS